MQISSMYSINHNINKSISFSSNGYMSFSDIETLINNGNLKAIQKLSDLSPVNKKQENLLHISARHNQAKITKYLLQKKLSPNIKNNHGKTPFSIACSTGNIELAEPFLLYDIDINSQDKLGNTPLHQAVNSPEITKLLLENKANPYILNDYEQSPFENSYKNPKTLEEYLKYGVNPNTENKNSQTLMHRSIKDGNIKVAQLLKNYDGDINYIDKDGKSPIFYGHDLNSFKWLIKNGAKINIRDKNGQTPLHQKVKESHINSAIILTKLGANPNIEDNNHLPPLAYAKSVKMMQALLNAGANPNVITPKGSTILHNCSKGNIIEAVYYLTQFKADPNILDNENNSPLDLTSNNDVRTLLLAAGANPNHRNYLIQALKTNNTEFLNNLLESGANPNLTNEEGMNCAFFIHNQKEIDKLKSAKLNLDLLNNDGYAPIHHFVLLGKPQMADLLIKNGAEKIKTKDDKSLEDCSEMYKKYNSWIKKSSNRPSFKGIFPYNTYGTPELRDKVEAKINLTKDDIDAIIKNAPSTDEGIVRAYKQLKNEEQKIYKAINSLFLILKHYSISSKEDISELYSANPKGSKIPVIGTVFQYTDTVFSDDFKNQLLTKMLKITAPYEQIIDNYYRNGIKNLAEKYGELNKYLSDGVKYVSYVDGKNQIRQKVLDCLNNCYNRSKEKDKNCAEKINKISSKYENTFNYIMEYQEAKQTKRTIRKTIRKIITLGMI